MGDAPNGVQRRREKLVKELLELRQQYKPFEARDDEICSLLKQDAKDEGGNFKVTIEGLGFVNVSAPKDQHRTGTSYELNLDKFLASPQRDQDRLIERGYARKIEVWKNAYYGAVNVTLFA
jgi:hypothetical protein